MTVDMVYDIFRKHNPVLACVAEGNNPLECFGIFQEVYHKGNGHYRSINLRIPYRPSHGSVEEGSGSRNFYKSFGSKS